MVSARLGRRRPGALPYAAVTLLLLSACASPAPEPAPPGPGQPAASLPAAALSQQGVASWYGPGFHGKKTTSGTVYDQYAMTAAHQTLPLGSSVLVTNLANGKSVTVLINDRGPFVKDRVIDLSYAAARAVDMIRPGTAPVRVEVLDTGGYDLKAIPHRLDYTLQVGAFADPDKARELKARLENRYDRPVVIEPHESYYRVRLGTFVGHSEASEYGARLSREGLPVVVVEKWPAVEKPEMKKPAMEKKGEPDAREPLCSLRSRPPEDTGLPLGGPVSRP